MHFAASFADWWFQGRLLASRLAGIDRDIPFAFTHTLGREAQFNCAHNSFLAEEMPKFPSWHGHPSSSHLASGRQLPRSRHKEKRYLIYMHCTETPSDHKTTKGDDTTASKSATQVVTTSNNVLVLLRWQQFQFWEPDSTLPMVFRSTSFCAESSSRCMAVAVGRSSGCTLQQPCQKFATGLKQNYGVYLWSHPGFDHAHICGWIWSTSRWDGNPFPSKNSILESIEVVVHAFPWLGLHHHFPQHHRKGPNVNRFREFSPLHLLRSHISRAAESACQGRAKSSK